MKFSRLAIVIYMGLVFASGAVLGMFGQRLYDAAPVLSNRRPNPEELRKKTLAEFQSRLKLTPDQVEKVNSIMDETRARVQETRKQMHPAYEKIHVEQQEKMRELLMPDQKLEFEKMLREREDERKKQNSGHGPGPGI